VRHAVKPVGNKFPVSDGVALAGQDEECGLERILGVVMIPEHPATNAPNHRPMAPDQGLEGRLLPMGSESLQESPIRESMKSPLAEEQL
jgi:hypothetical protein